MECALDHNSTESFLKILVDKTWSFVDKTVKDKNYIPHGFYTYPAKFIPLKSFLEESTVQALGKTRIGLSVSNYFIDMSESFIEMKRVLKPRGRVAIVIGNTRLKGVDILNAEIFKQPLSARGFSPVKIIKRAIPSKMLPSTRDKNREIHQPRERRQKTRLPRRVHSDYAKIIKSARHQQGNHKHLKTPQRSLHILHFFPSSSASTPDQLGYKLP